MKLPIYTPKQISKSEKIFLPDHPASDKRGYINIDHPDLLDELIYSIENKIEIRRRILKANMKNKSYEQNPG